MQIKLKINGIDRAFNCDASTTLADLLRYQGYSEIKFGCGEGVCGACTVLMDGKPVTSCNLFAWQADGRELTTAAGIDRQQVRKIQSNIAINEGLQCGYCGPGLTCGISGLIDTIGDGDAAKIRKLLAGHVCRCTALRQVVESVDIWRKERPCPPEAPSHHVCRKMRGDWTYPTDIPKHIGRPLVGRIFWSEIPHGLVCVNPSVARAVMGVVEVLTAADIRGKNRGGVIPVLDNQPIIAQDLHPDCRWAEVRSFGDAVALVVAEDEDSAVKGLEAVDVEDAKWTPEFDVREAVKTKENIVSPFAYLKGDVEKAFNDRNNIVVEEEYESGIQDHAAMELEGGVGWMEQGKIVLRVQSQNPYAVRESVAVILGINRDRVEIQSVNIGGSFGKYLSDSIAGWLALMVWHTKRPVRLVLSRQESLQRRSKRHPLVGTVKLAIGRNTGQIRALEMGLLCDAGAYPSITPAISQVFASEAHGAYHIPNVSVLARGVLTNAPPNAAMRGYGSQQIHFIIESAMQKAVVALKKAHESMASYDLRTLSIDVRKANHIEYHRDALTALDRCVSMVEQRRKKDIETPEGWLQGRGVASVFAKYGWSDGFADRFSVRLVLGTDGKFTLYSPIADAGTGAVQELQRIVQERLNLDEPPENVVEFDPIMGERFPWTGGFYYWFESMQMKATAWFFRRIPKGADAETVAAHWRRWSRLLNTSLAASRRVKDFLYPRAADMCAFRVGSARSMMMAGKAVENACALMIEKAVTRWHKLRLDMGYDSLNESYDWGAIGEYAGKIEAIGTHELTPAKLVDPKTGNQRGYRGMVSAAHACEVAVNPHTGEVKILDYQVAQDVGKALNRIVIENQIQGAVVMGVGHALREHIEFDENGKVATDGLHQYAVQTSLDADYPIRVHIIESGREPKGVAEAGIVGVVPCIANAIFDATGVQPKTIPITSEWVWQACKGR